MYASERMSGAADASTTPPIVGTAALGCLGGTLLAWSALPA